MLDAVILMGVAGCGKSTIGEALAAQSPFEYLDGDELHPQANIDKMSAGQPLDDDDRWPWLGDIGRKFAHNDKPMAIGCSALKTKYRQRIALKAQKPVCFVHLNGSKELILGRMQERQGHFMPTALLDSQFADLELLKPDELGFSVSIDQNIDNIICDIIKKLEECS